jgi:hypothetical protein
LLADTFGRFVVLGGYLTKMGVNRALFGRETICANIDFPRALTNLISMFPPNHQYTADGLIDNHTILPYYAPFLPPARLAEIRMMMKTYSKKQISPKIGIPTFKVKRPAFLRYCPVCAAKEQTSGFCFFHVVAQLEGVELCPEHGAFLVSTPVSIKTQMWVCAESVISHVPDPKYADLNSAEGMHLLAIAKDCQWLLDHPNIVMGPDEILRRYQVILANRGLASATGKPAQKRIREHVRKLYSSELLERLGCPLKSNDDWLHKLLGHRTALPPLYHILFIRYLGLSLEQFFLQDWQLSPFGKGPWPCFNPVTYSHKYAATTITEVRIASKYDSKMRMNRIIGIFSCECGYSYWLRSDTQRSKRAPHSRNVISRGKIWDDALREAWNDLSIYNLRLKFKMRWSDLLVEANRLNLFVIRSGKSISDYIENKIPKPIPALTQDEEEKLSAKRDRMQQEWLQLQKEYPDHNTQKLKELKPQVYTWLSKKDRDWLHKNKPSRAINVYNWTKEDLSQVDSEIAALLPDASEKLKAATGTLKRVTATAMLNHVGKYQFAKRHQLNLPITWDVAKHLAESDEDWAERRRSYYSE